ncbi:MFS transporter, partial [Francisella tularensis subsp. holarctica]|nr:MFS transporter [Francisella tularensis subsp. holarctica]
KHILLKSNSWLALGVVSLGFVGLCAWYSYISPLMINVTQLSNSTITYILFLAGLGMFFGNLYGVKLTDRVGAMNATVV